VTRGDDQRNTLVSFSVAHLSRGEFEHL
jgi:hypothetical protein